MGRPVHEPSSRFVSSPTRTAGITRVPVQQLRGRFSMLIVEQNKTFLHALADDVLVMRGGQLSSHEHRESSHGN